MTSHFNLRKFVAEIAAIEFGTSASGQMHLYSPFHKFLSVFVHLITIGNYGTGCTLTGIEFYRVIQGLIKITRYVNAKMSPITILCEFINL